MKVHFIIQSVHIHSNSVISSFEKELIYRQIFLWKKFESILSKLLPPKKIIVCDLVLFKKIDFAMNGMHG